MSEVALWETLRGLLPRGQYSRVESGDTAPGFPDVHYQLRDPNISGTSISGTIELKDSRRTIGIPFRNEDEGIHLSQKIWIAENVANGGICWVVARVRNTIFWIPGSQADMINGRADLLPISTWQMDLRRVYNKDTQNINKMLRGMLL